MKITESHLRKVIREEIATINSDAIKDVVMSVLKDEGGAAGLDPIASALEDLENDDVSLPDDSIEDIIKSVAGVKQHKDGDYIDTTRLESAQRDVKKIIREALQISEAISYHTSRGVGVEKNIFRPGSSSFFSLFREARKLFREGKYIPISEEERELLEDTDIGEFAVFEGQWVPLDYPIMSGTEEHLNEAEYKGKKVKLNKPVRGGDKGKAYVYVNTGKKTKDNKVKVKKVTFGSSMPDAMGDSEKHRKRRKSFGDRHNCADKKDKTKPGYWSCRLTKFFGRDISGWW